MNVIFDIHFSFQLTRKMVYTEESDLQVLKNSKSSKCKDAADELKRCLKETQCFKAGGKSMAECLLETSECQVSL